MNFQMFFGCPPATGVKSDTTMVYDITKILSEQLDLETMSLILPQALEEVTGQDASFEVA